MVVELIGAYEEFNAILFVRLKQHGFEQEMLVLLKEVSH